MKLITLIAIIIGIVAILLGLGLSIIFWAYTFKKDDSISEHEDEFEYLYEFYLDDDDIRINN